MAADDWVAETSEEIEHRAYEEGWRDGIQAASEAAKTVDVVVRFTDWTPFLAAAWAKRRCIDAIDNLRRAS